MPGERKLAVDICGWRHGLVRLSGSVRLAALLAAGAVTAGCQAPTDEMSAPSTAQVSGDIINGTAVSVDNVGTPKLTLSDPLLNGNCSGTILKSDWLLTAHHCV